jgi:SlyX protein
MPLRSRLHFSDFVSKFCLRKELERLKVVFLHTHVYVEHRLNGGAMNEQRLIDLEIKISHQEVAIDELQTTVFEQHSAIARLEKTLKDITDRLEGVTGKEVGPGNEKPPHY